MLAHTLKVEADEHPVAVYLSCGRCQSRESVTTLRLVELVRLYGPTYSLHHRTPPCRHCGGKRFFSATSGGPGAIVFPLTDPMTFEEAQRIHELWRLVSKRDRTGG